MGRSVRLHGPRNWQQSSQKAPTINRKGQKNCDNNNPFLSSEITICSLLHFGCFGNKITNFVPQFLNIFCYFLSNV